MRLGKLRYVPWAVGLAMVTVPVAAQAATNSKPLCAAVTLSARPYTQGHTNTVSWSGGEAGQYLFEWSSSNAVDATGAFVTPEGGGELPTTTTSQTVDNLSEGTHYYHVLSEGHTVCDNPVWSDVASTIQDNTPPQVTITSSSPVVGQTTTITGTATDTGSGVAGVVVSLTNTTPALGTTLGQPDSVTVTPDANGNWSATFAGVKPGLYTITASATDNALNGPTTASKPDVLIVALG